MAGNPASTPHRAFHGRKQTLQHGNDPSLVSGILANIGKNAMGSGNAGLGKKNAGGQTP
jgi:hypothetical protein